VTDDELMAGLAKRFEKSLYAAGCFKGLPEDKHYEELNIAGIVLEHNGVPVLSLDSEPYGPDTAPDVGITLQSGERIGLEVTELVDGPLRGRYARRRAAEHAKELSPKDVFDAVLGTGIDPVPADNTFPAFGEYRVWDEKEIAAQLDDLVERKDTNTHLRGHAADYDSIWLVVFTGEQHINDFPDLVQKAIVHITYRPTLIGRVFVILDYMPGQNDSGYPVIEISSAYI
jgi:hypothetical protein